MTKSERQAEKERLMTAARLRTILNYDCDTGIFTWRTGSKGRRVGAEAGRFSGAGYRQIQIDGMFFYAHRLAWLYVTGKWPSSQVDHRDTVKSNNSFENLRLAERVQNQGNRHANANNTCRIKGVRYLSKIQKWQARITHEGKCVHLGNFSSSTEAAAAYSTAAKKKFGIFARTA